MKEVYVPKKFDLVDRETISDAKENTNGNTVAGKQQYVQPVLLLPLLQP